MESCRVRARGWGMTREKAFVRVRVCEDDDDAGLSWRLPHDAQAGSGRGAPADGPAGSVGVIAAQSGPKARRMYADGRPTQSPPPVVYCSTVIHDCCH
nr:unnamed protein product [Digitaria exilis]